MNANATGGTEHDPEGPAAGSKVCSECLSVYFSKWGHAKTCSRYPDAEHGGNHD